MSPPSVIIVGAGLSGLSAAQRLYKRGISFAVLEAQQRVGGRVFTCIEGDFQEELGATWFHGATKANEAWKIAVDAGIVSNTEENDGDTSPTGTESSDLGVWLLSHPPAIVDSMEVCRVATIDEHEKILTIAQRYCKLLARAEDSNQCQVDDPRVALYSYLRNGFSDLKMNEIEKAAFRACDLLESSYNGCNSSTSQISALRHSEYKKLAGVDARLVPPHGMVDLVQAFRSFPPKFIRLNAEVTRIRYPKDIDSVEVRLVNGERLSCRCVLWTPSVNVTKRLVENDCFDPPLPVWKTDALRGTGQGVVDKVFAVLEAGLQGVSSKHVMPVLWLKPYVKGDSYKHVWTRTIYSLSYDSHTLAVSFWLTGDGALTFENLTDEEAREQTERSLFTLQTKRKSDKDLSFEMGYESLHRRELFIPSRRQQYAYEEASGSSIT